MDTHLIYKKSKKNYQNIDWINSGETEWQYCGAAGEVKWDIVTEATEHFFDDSQLFVVTTSNDSFETGKDNLISSIQQLVGSKNFFIWDKNFQKAMEFNQIGVFRIGVYNADMRRANFKISYKKMGPGSPDKVNGKAVKYKKGDCLCLDCSNGKYLAVFVAEKFNKYYDFTLLEFYEERKPVLADFVNGNFFGCYGEVTEKVYPLTERLMLLCREVDANLFIKAIGSLELIEPLEKVSYGSYKDIATILQHYQEDLPKRKLNTENFNKLPHQLFISNRLIEMNKILQMPVTPT